MKAFLLGFVFVFVSASASFASLQTVHVDSLMSALAQHTEPDIEQVDLLNSLAYGLYAIDIEKSLVYATEAAEKSDVLNYIEGKAEAIRLIGRYYLTLSDYTEAERYFNEAFLLFQETGDQQGLYRTLNNIGIVHYYRGDLSRSFDYYQRSLEIALGRGDNDGVSAAYNNLGLIHLQQENYEEALNSFNRALTLNVEANDIRGSASTLNNIGNLYLATGDHVKARENLERALLLSVEARTPALEGNSRNALSSLFLKTNQYTRALPYASEAYRLAMETGDADLIRRSAENLVVQKRKRNHLLAEKNQHIELMNGSLVQLNADKDRFMQILAHDLRSPFNALLGFSELLKENFDNYDKAAIHKMIHMIHGNLVSTYKLVEDLLLWANSQDGKLPFEPSPINLLERSQEIIEDQRDKAKAKGIEIKNHIEGDIALIADCNMIRTVLRNLLSNAIKYTGNGGAIDLSAMIAGEDVEIHVSDTGRGMDGVEISMLWDIKINHSTEGTAGEKGSGLGLLICREFVEKHGCKIWVKSIPHKGTTFIFTMPLYKA